MFEIHILFMSSTFFHSHCSFGVNRTRITPCQDFLPYKGYLFITYKLPSEHMQRTTNNRHSFLSPREDYRRLLLSIISKRVFFSTYFIDVYKSAFNENIVDHAAEIFILESSLHENKLLFFQQKIAVMK